MAWVQFNESGVICGVCANQQNGAFASERELPDDDPTIIAYLKPPAPTSCTKLGLKRAFDELGQWTTIRTAIESNANTQEEWDLATEIKRTDSLVQGMISSLQLTPEQVDNLLIRANALV
jgi:hypothetical protein